MIYSTQMNLLGKTRSIHFHRGRTLRLLTRVMHVGILEPLLSSILENLTYKNHAYVRQNCVSLLYKIYLHFKGNEIYYMLR